MAKTNFQTHSKLHILSYSTPRSFLPWYIPFMSWRPVSGPGSYG
ncbi:hypothetical protein [Enterocloster sp.]